MTKTRTPLSQQLFACPFPSFPCAMAAAAHKNNNSAVIVSVDYDGDPIQDETGGT